MEDSICDGADDVDLAAKTDTGYEVRGNPQPELKRLISGLRPRSPRDEHDKVGPYTRARIRADRGGDPGRWDGIGSGGGYLRRRLAPHLLFVFLAVRRW